MIIALLPAAILLILLLISVRRKPKNDFGTTTAPITPVHSVTPYHLRSPVQSVTSERGPIYGSQFTSVSPKTEINNFPKPRDCTFGSYFSSVTPRVIEPDDLEFLSRGVDPETEHGQRFEVRQMCGKEFVSRLKGLNSDPSPTITMYWDKNRRKLVCDLKMFLEKKDGE